MSDTQWPRFEVFLQEADGAPHQDAGSVHAPDAEMALLNARDVFVRRPSCVSLWVAPAGAIYARTAEEIAEHGLEQGSPTGSREAYLVFTKVRSAGTQTYLGSVEASSPQEALRQAVEQFSGERQPFVWWVLPARSILQSQPQDNDSLFAPALDKPFRLSTDFHTLTAMKKIKAGKKD